MKRTHFKKPTTRKCRDCKTKFDIPSENPFAEFCSDRCRQSFTEKAIAKARSNQERNRKKLVKEASDRSRHEIKRLKEKGLTHGDYENMLQKEINTIVRLIDYGANCISCNRPISTVGYKMTGKPQASHRHSVGSNNSIRFMLFNNFVGCYRCNVQYAGNPDGYDKGLEATFGKEVAEYVKYEIVRLYPIIKLSIPELKDKIAAAKEIVKELKSVGNTYSVQDRLELRREYDVRIGIYAK